MCYYYEIHYVLAFVFIYIFIADNISISMYIMCVVLWLFSALSRRVGTLQISIIIIVIIVTAGLWYCEETGPRY